MPAPSPETKLHILKDKASLYGLSVRDIGITAQVALKGYVATKFKEKGGQEDVDIRVRLRPEDRNNLSNLRRLLIHSPLGIDIPLSEVAYLTKGSGPTEIKRIEQQRSIMVTANVFRRNLNQVANQINSALGPLRSNKALKDYSLELAGEQQRMKESFNSLAFALILAFTLVYMIMAAEFESLWQPFLIMFTVPLSLIGVAFTLFITRTPLSVVAYLGIIMLGGIAVNNGIVLIDFVNNLRKEGYSAYEAVVEASKTRLRPILMTSLTTILGLLPLALGMGEGAELQAPLALTVMGGLTSATFLTLVFIPALYVIVAERLEKIPVSIETQITPEIKIATEPIETSKELVPYKAQPTTQIQIVQNEIKTELKSTPSPAVAISETKSLTRPVPIAKAITPATAPPAELIKIEAVPPSDKQELNPRQKELLEKLKEIKKITRKECAQMFRVSIPTAARDLKELTDKKLLKAQGPLGPGRWYELI
jgi:HAE1 family hydrophobic/amphiphilic exporter-1